MAEIELSSFMATAPLSCVPKLLRRRERGEKSECARRGDGSGRYPLLSAAAPHFVIPGDPRLNWTLSGDAG
jgi:hypothetical protein